MGCPDEAELVGWLQRSLSDERRQQLEDHFDACDDCRRLVFALAAGDASTADDGNDGDAADEPAPSAAPGTQIGRFTLERVIAAGGMGVVYRAHDPTLRRAVALKLLHARTRTQPAADLRLVREAQGLARLHHPHVVAVYDAGLHAGEVFVAMELIDGAPLDRWLAARARGWREIAAVFEQAGRGLAAAHAAGLVHRDVKPSNIMVAASGRAVVIDFGLARDADAPAAAPLEQADLPTELDGKLTRTGALIGTPAYAAPEQLIGGTVDRATDVFAFSVTLFEALYGRRPFVAPTAAALIERMRAGVELPAAPRIPARLRAALRRGLHADRAQRAASLDELLAALVDRRPLRRGVAVVAAAAAIAIAVPIAARVVADAPAPCTGSAAELAAVWNPTQRAALEAALRATGVPFASDTWRTISAELDGYASRWTAMHAETCRATAVHHTQSPQLLDRRIACLDSRRDALDAAIHTLGELDRNTARDAPRLASELPPLASCADAAQLLALSPLPGDPVSRAQLGPLRGAIARSEALSRAGKYAAGLDQATTAAAIAARLGYQPLEAEALLARGVAEEGLVRRGDARVSLERAIWAAAESAHAEVEARALTALALLLVDRSPDGLIARTHARHALAIAERLGDRPLLEADARFAVANALIGIDHAGVLAELDRGSALLDRAAIADRTAAGIRRVDYDNVRARLEPNPDIALDIYRGILRLAEQIYGPNHPRVAAVLGDMVTEAANAERFPEARALARRAADILAPYPGSQAGVRLVEAAADPVAASRLVTLRAARSDLVLLHGGEGPQLAEVDQSIAEALLELGHPREAAAEIRRAIENRERAYGSEGERLIPLLFTASDIYRRFDPEASLASAERAAAIARGRSVNPMLRMTVTLLLADAYFRRGRYAATLELLPEVRWLMYRIGERPAYVLELDFVEAACHWGLGIDPVASLRRARSLHARYRVRTDADPPSVADQAAWLAGKR